MGIHRYFSLKTPCSNCPFLKKGAIPLAAGRLESIVNGLVENDHTTFQCHKTVHCEKGGDWDKATGKYHASGNEMACAGAVAYLLKIQQPGVMMRVAMMTKVLDRESYLARCAPLIIDGLLNCET